MNEQDYREPSERRDPVIENRAKYPTGNIPRGRQLWVILTVSTLIVLAVLFSGSGTNQPRTAPLAPLQAHTTSKDVIQKYTDRLREEEARLKLAQDQAARARTDYGAMNAAIEDGIPGQAPIGPDGRPQYPQYQQAEQIDPLEAEQRKKEYASLFASNIALSARPKETSMAAKPEPTPTDTPAPQPAAHPVTETTATEKEPAAVPAYHHKLFEGHLLEAVLVNRLEGDFAGPVNCMVTTAVYSHNGQTLLIPQGTRVLGEARKVQDRDQQRLAVVFHRMIMPDGFSVNLDQMLGLDQAGATALKDKVNKHYLSTFGTSILLGLLSGFAMYNTQGAYLGDGSDMYRQGVANQLSRDAQQILNRQMNRMPDITIREGHRVKLMLSKDLMLPAYDKHPAIPGV